VPQFNNVFLILFYVVRPKLFEFPSVLNTPQGQRDLTCVITKLLKRVITKEIKTVIIINLNLLLWLSNMVQITVLFVFIKLLDYRFQRLIESRFRLRKL
jgi:hypothetical protein